MKIEVKEYKSPALTKKYYELVLVLDNGTEYRINKYNNGHKSHIENQLKLPTIAPLIGKLCMEYGADLLMTNPFITTAGFS